MRQAQRSQTPPHPGVSGAEGDGESDRRLAVRGTFHIDQNQGLPIGTGEGIQRPADPLDRLGPLPCIVRRTSDRPTSEAFPSPGMPRRIDGYPPTLDPPDADASAMNDGMHTGIGRPGAH